MPLSLVPPKPGRTPHWRVRGHYLGIPVDRSAKTTERAKAAKLRSKIEDEIERGAYAKPGEPTFVDAAANYIASTGNARFLKPIVDHFGFMPLRQIDQQAIDKAAIALYPGATPATRNRQIYSPVSAVLKSAGFKGKIDRPEGWRGKARVTWLKPPQAFALFRAADAKDPEFGIFLRVLTYTGMRLSECTGMTIELLELSEAFAYVAMTKNDEPRGVHLPPVVVAALANHPRGLDRKGQRVFRFVKCGRLYTWLDESLTAAGIALPPRTGFHVLRHTWATWMRRYGGLDTRGLVGTGAWKDERSASRYEHVIATEEARRADLLPTEGDSGKTRAKRTSKRTSR